MTNQYPDKASDDIYLSENRFEKPKETFKTALQFIREKASGGPQTALDVGCATGEFLYYLGSQLADFRLAGVDPSEKMILAARSRLPDATFQIGSADDFAVIANDKYDFVVCMGVLGFFDEIGAAKILDNLVSATRDGGMIVIHGQFNDLPIDAITKYRRTDRDTTGEWEGGWNMLSHNTINHMLEELDRDITWEWTPFELPFAIEQREDLMRSWTIRTEDNPYQRVNGARQLVRTNFLVIRVAP